VYIEGKLRTRSYDDKDGIKRYVTEILGQQLNLVGARQNDGASETSNHTQQSSVPESMINEPLPSALSSIDVDDLPF
jgi:single-strand DNA-binding protein